MGYLTNAIKALFTRNTTNAASVSGARIPIVEQNGNPIGNDSMSNLAAVLGVARIKKQTIAPGEEVVIMSITETSLVCVGQRASSGGNPGVFVLTSLGKEAQITEGYGIVLGGSEPTTGSLWVHCDTISGLWKVKNVYTSNRALSVAVILLENG